MKLAVGLCFLSGAALVVLYGILIGVMVPGWQNSVDELWNVAAKETRDAMLEVVNSTLSFIRFSAVVVPQLHEQMPTSTSNATYDPTFLLRTFAAFNRFSGYQFGSMGFLMHAAPPHPATAKLSWQVASGYGCPSYMYAYSDNAIYPQFLGYCGTWNGVVNFTAPAYVGTDWGLKPQEMALLNGTLKDGLFLPVFDLFGAFTLTYEAAYSNIVTFAELDLNMLSNHINTQMVLLDGKALAYIYETATGLMIASNINGTIFDGNHTRYSIINVTSDIIRDTADGQDPAWLITLTRRTEPGLNWTIVVGVLNQDIKGNIQKAIVTVSVATLFVLLVLICFTWIGIHFCVTRQLRAKREGSSSIPYTMFDEVK